MSNEASLNQVGTTALSEHDPTNSVRLNLNTAEPEEPLSTILTSFAGVATSLVFIESYNPARAGNSPFDSHSVSTIQANPETFETSNSNIEASDVSSVITSNLSGFSTMSTSLDPNSTPVYPINSQQAAAGMFSSNKISLVSTILVFFAMI